jgi:hypothetical protein
VWLACSAARRPLFLCCRAAGSLFWLKSCDFDFRDWRARPRIVVVARHSGEPQIVGPTAALLFSCRVDPQQSSPLQQWTAPAMLLFGGGIVRLNLTFRVVSIASYILGRTNCCTAGHARRQSLTRAIAADANECECRLVVRLWPARLHANDFDMGERQDEATWSFGDKSTTSPCPARAALATRTTRGKNRNSLSDKTAQTKLSRVGFIRMENGVCRITPEGKQELDRRATQPASTARAFFPISVRVS